MANYDVVYQVLSTFHAAINKKGKEIAILSTFTESVARLCYERSILNISHNEIEPNLTHSVRMITITGGVEEEIFKWSYIKVQVDHEFINE